MKTTRAQNAESTLDIIIPGCLFGMVLRSGACTAHAEQARSAVVSCSHKEAKLITYKRCQFVGRRFCECGDSSYVVPVGLRACSDPVYVGSQDVATAHLPEQLCVYFKQVRLWVSVRC